MARAVFMEELRLIWPVWVGVPVSEPSKLAKHIAAGTAQPLREHPGRDSQIVALAASAAGFRRPRKGAQLGYLWAENVLYGIQ
jgi:hypothetical protein